MQRFHFVLSELQTRHNILLDFHWPQRCLLHRFLSSLACYGGLEGILSLLRVVMRVLRSIRECLMRKALEVLSMGQVTEREEAERRRLTQWFQRSTSRSTLKFYVDNEIQHIPST